MGIRSVAQDNQTTRIANQRCENLLISLIEKNIFKNQKSNGILHAYAKITDE